MNDLLTEKTMTIREVAEALNVSIELITKKIRELFPDKMETGKTTYLNETEVTAINLTIKQNPHLVQSYEVKTKLEKALLIKQAMAFQDELINELSTENQSLKSTVKLLVHSTKTYTASELAAELRFKSPQEFNDELHKMGIQYKVNTTWKLYSQYEGLNYTETKSGTSESGYPFYNMHWTGEGRLFLLNLFPSKVKETQLNFGGAK